MGADQAGAVEDQPEAVQLDLGDLRLAILGIVLDGGPRGLFDLLDQRPDRLAQLDADRGSSRCARRAARGRAAHRRTGRSRAGCWPCPCGCGSAAPRRCPRAPPGSGDTRASWCTGSWRPASGSRGPRRRSCRCRSPTAHHRACACLPRARERPVELAECPRVNARRNVPSVEGVITRCPRIRPLDPARSTFMSSIESARGEHPVHQREHLAARQARAPRAGVEPHAIKSMLRRTFNLRLGRNRCHYAVDPG